MGIVIWRKGSGFHLHQNKAINHCGGSLQSHRTQRSSFKQTNTCSGEETFLLYPSFLLSLCASTSSAWHLSLFFCLPLYFFVLTSLISSCYKNELALTPDWLLKGNPSQEGLCPLWFLSNFRCNCLAVQSRLYKLINTFKYDAELRRNNSETLWGWKNVSSLCGWILRTDWCTEKQRAASKETQSGSHAAVHNDGFRWRLVHRVSKVVSLLAATFSNLLNNVLTRCLFYPE